MPPDLFLSLAPIPLVALGAFALGRWTERRAQTRRNVARVVERMREETSAIDLRGVDLEFSSRPPSLRIVRLPLEVNGPCSSRGTTRGHHGDP